jgi:hypothetical protein
MTNNGIVNIHGKEYMTVARRVEMAHEGRGLESVETEVVSHEPVVIKAKVTVKGKTYTGISAVLKENARLIEKQNPYEVAETSAVGRALGFAGFGIIESVASADELVRTTSPLADGDRKVAVATKSGAGQQYLTKQVSSTTTCEVCGQAATEKKGTTRGGKQYHGVFCTSEDRSHTRWLWN